MSRARMYDDEAERSVLGSILLTPDVLADVQEQLAPDDFERESHAVTFRAMCDLGADRQPIDYVTLADRLRANGDLERAGGIGAVTMLDTYTPSSGNWRRYADIVRELSLRRRLVEAAATIIDQAQDRERVVVDVVGGAEQLIHRVGERRAVKGIEPFRDVLARNFKRYEELSLRTSDLTGIPSGLSGIDELTGGFQDNDLIVLAARPGCGKTSAMMGWALAAARHVGEDGGAVVVFEQEMEADQLVDRILSAEAGVNGTTFRSGRFTSSDFPRLANAMNRIYQCPLYMDDTPNLSVPEMRAKLRRIRARHGKVRWVGVDYIQLLRSTDRGAKDFERISEVVAGCKMIAREFQCPVVALSQLNRQLEQRADKRPTMSDLRGSGSIEQDADVVVFIYRDEVYDKDSDAKGEAEFIIAKQRRGPTGTVTARFDHAFTRFANMPQDRGRF